MLRYLRLTFALLRYSLMREMMFKGNFLLWIVVEFAWFCIQLTLIEVIYSHVDTVAGWGKYQMMILMGTSHGVQQLFQFLFMINCMDLPENVRTGKLDFALLQPANSQFLASVRKFDFGSIVNGTIGFCVVAYGVHQLKIDVSLSHLLVFIALVINGALIHYALMLILVTLSFWIVRAQGLVYGYYNLFQISRIPRQAFRGVIRLLFTFALPMLVVANFPAEVLAQGLGGPGVLWAFGIAGFFLVVSSVWFRFGMRYYTSASS
jgi:ABC-2 type transport system permease protein